MALKVNKPVRLRQPITWTDCERVCPRRLWAKLTTFLIIILTLIDYFCWQNSRLVAHSGRCSSPPRWCSPARCHPPCLSPVRPASPCDFQRACHHHHEHICLDPRVCVCARERDNEWAFATQFKVCRVFLNFW